MNNPLHTQTRFALRPVGLSRIVRGYSPALLLAMLLGAALPAVQGADQPMPTPELATLKTTIEVPDAWYRIAKKLPGYVADGPLSEVARSLRKEFDDTFDVVLVRDAPDPRTVVNGPVDPQTGLPVQAPRVDPEDWGSLHVGLDLKNVMVWDVFNAMNLQLQISKKPVRWELIVNGERPTAVLRVLDVSELLPVVAVPPREEKREVIYVGEILEKNTPGGMSMPEVLQTLTEVDEESRGDGSKPTISAYDPGDLMIIRGTEEQLNFIRSTLQALQRKVFLAQKLLKAKPEASPASSNTPSTGRVDGK